MKIGVTDRIREVGPIEREFQNSCERECEGDRAEFVFLNSLDEADFDAVALAELDALLVWHARITESTARRLKKCRIVVRYGIGFDQVDVAALTRAGIRFANNPSYCTEEVADTATAMILNGARGVTLHDALAKGYGTSWQENNRATWRLRTRHVGLVGLGRIGMATALRLKAFGLRISAFDPYREEGVCKSLGIQHVRHLDELLRSADIVSLHCPLTDETSGMVDAQFLRRMKSDAILVNTGRGKLLQSTDVLEAHMRANPGFRAFLDVLPDEPPVNDGLIAAWRQYAGWLAGRLVINPHNAYYSDGSDVEQRTEALATIRLALCDGVFRYTLN